MNVIEGRFDRRATHRIFSEPVAIETVMDVVAKAVASGPHLMGEQFTAADVVIGSGLRWGMMFKLLPERPEFTAYVSRLAQRPALQRAEAKDKELAAA